MATRQFRGSVLLGPPATAGEPARIAVEPSQLRASMSDGREFLLSFQGMHIRAEGFGRNALTCHNADRSVGVVCDEPGFIFALTCRAGRQQRDDLAPLPRRPHRADVQRAAAAAAVIVLALGLAVALPPALRHALTYAAHSSQPQVDAAVGALALQRRGLDGPVQNAGPLWQATQQALARLVAAQDGRGHAPHYRAHLVDSPTALTYALPSGDLVLAVPLATLAWQAGALDALLAHEMAHVVLRHGIARLAQAVGVVPTLELCFGDAQRALLHRDAALGPQVMGRGTPAEEAEADHLALQLLAAAGAQPDALARLLEAVARQAPKSPWLADGSVSQRLALLQAADAGRPSRAAEAPDRAAPTP